MNKITRYIADIIIGILMALSCVWVDVNWFHRLYIGIIFVLAAETVLRYIDERTSRIDDKTYEEKKKHNRDIIFETWRREG